MSVTNKPKYSHGWILIQIHKRLSTLLEYIFNSGKLYATHSVPATYQGSSSLGLSVPIGE